MIYKKRLVNEIMKAEVGEEINLNQYRFYFDKIVFEQQGENCLEHELRGQYSWTAYSGWRTTFPMRNSEYVKFFKTLKGAKRNFIRYIKWLLEE